eukprot:scaffold63838_cov45-Phaeocystis_antarctica.AAC.1
MRLTGVAGAPPINNLGARSCVGGCPEQGGAVGAGASRGCAPCLWFCCCVGCVVCTGHSLVGPCPCRSTIARGLPARGRACSAWGGGLERSCDQDAESALEAARARLA